MELPLYLLIVFIVLAVAAGLWLGSRAGKAIEAREKERQSLGSRARTAATDGLIKLWKWNRNRKKDDDE